MKRAQQLVKENEAGTARFFGPLSASLSNPNASHLVPEQSDDTIMVRMSTLYNDLYRGAHEREKAQNAAAAARGIIPSKSPPKRARTVISSGDGDTQMAVADNAAAESIPAEMFERVENQTVARKKVPNGNANSNSDVLTIMNGDTNGTNGVTAAAARAKSATALVLQSGVSNGMRSSTSIAETLASDRPTWHAPWRIYRTISGHLGWVRCAAVDSSNEWFATGSADRTIKIWSLSTGQLRLTLPGHVAGVRALEVSSRHPYLFSAGEDKAIKCWDLEQNKVVRKYHGSLSGVYALALHPTLNVLVTGGRDSAVRVWDMRTRVQVMNLGGHRDGINSLIVQKYDPQIVSASVDSTVRLWDLTAGKCASVLTNHKRGVRSVVANPAEFSFASASIDAIKTWAFPHGNFMRNLRSTDNPETRKTLVNCMAINEDGVLVSGGNDGSLKFWDYNSAHAFQHTNTIVQPGSLDCERGILDAKFDKSGSRLITCEIDKTIKMWKEDTDATPETHPVDWKPDLRPRYY